MWVRGDHAKNHAKGGEWIVAKGEQDPERTHKYFLLVRLEGNRSVRRNMSHHNHRKMEMLQYESDYDRAIKELIHKENSLPAKGEPDDEN